MHEFPGKKHRLGGTFPRYRGPRIFTPLHTRLAQNSGHLTRGSSPTPLATASAIFSRWVSSPLKTNLVSGMPGGSWALA